MFAWTRHGILALLSLIVSPPTLAGETIGLVLMHGKHTNMSPMGKKGGGGLDNVQLRLASLLEREGILVEVPELPWSKGRDFDVTYGEALKEIDAAADKLRGRGATKIAVGGHSLGANAAFAYASQRPGKVFAIVALSPGHVPDINGEKLANSIAKARTMVAEGRGRETANFEDINQGEVINISSRAEIYLSYMNPQGLAAMPVTAAAIQEPIPILWEVGERDRMAQRGRYVIDKAPQHPGTRYDVVSGDHFTAPAITARDIIEWLKSLSH